MGEPLTENLVGTGDSQRIPADKAALRLRRVFVIRVLRLTWRSSSELTVYRDTTGLLPDRVRSGTGDACIEPPVSASSQTGPVGLVLTSTPKGFMRHPLSLRCAQYMPFSFLFLRFLQAFPPWGPYLQVHFFLLAA